MLAHDQFITKGAVTVSTGGIALFGVVTGLHPTALIAGFCGGLFALGCQPLPLPVARRVWLTVGASMVASYLAPIATDLARAHGAVPATVAQEVVFPAVAFLLGFLSHSVIGPAAVALAKKLFSIGDNK